MNATLFSKTLKITVFHVVPVQQPNSIIGVIFKHMWRLRQSLRDRYFFRITTTDLIPSY